MDLDFVRQRITELRMQKGVSEYKMSTDLGHSRSYIQNIVSGRSAPSLQELFYICEYLDVTVSTFFDSDITQPILFQRASIGLRKLKDSELLMVIPIIDRLGENE